MVTADFQGQPALLVGGQRVRELVEVALEDRVEAMLGELDAVVGEPVLGEVVRADLLRPLAAADLGAARGRLLCLPQLALVLVEACAQHAHAPCRGS